MAHDALPEILSAEKIPEILITEIGKALTLKSFAMLVDKPCDLEAALHSGLPASASDQYASSLGHSLCPQRKRRNGALRWTSRCRSPQRGPGLREVLGSDMASDRMLHCDSR